MTAKEVEAKVRRLPPEELRQFAEWWDAYRQRLALDAPVHSLARPDTGALKAANPPDATLPTR